MAAIVGYHRPRPAYLCNLTGNQVFLSFHSNIASLVRENSMPPPTIGDNQKSPPQADLRHVKSRTCVWLSPIQINIDSLGALLL